MLPRDALACEIAGTLNSFAPERESRDETDDCLRDSTGHDKKIRQARLRQIG
jgi:hypothetical protein